MMMTPLCPRSLCPLKKALDYSQACSRADCPMKPQPVRVKEREKPIELVDHKRIGKLHLVG